jgi:hypothetical protein
MTASFRFISSSLFTVNQSFNAIQFQLLTVSLNKVNVNKQIRLESKKNEYTFLSLLTYVLLNDALSISDYTTSNIIINELQTEMMCNEAVVA